MTACPPDRKIAPVAKGAVRGGVPERVAQSRLAFVLPMQPNG
jgi:hypothetical protein